MVILLFYREKAMHPVQLQQVSYFDCLKKREYSYFLVKLDNQTKNMFGLSIVVAINTLALKHLIFPILSLCGNSPDNYYVRYIQAKDSWKSLLLMVPFANFYVNYMERNKEKEFNQVVQKVLETLSHEQQVNFLKWLENYKNHYSLIDFKNIETNGDFYYFIIKNSKNYELLQFASKELKEQVIALARFYHDEIVLDALREHQFIPEIVRSGNIPQTLPIDVLTVIRPFLDSEDQLSLALVTKSHYKATSSGYYQQFQNVLLLLENNGLIELDFYKTFIHEAFRLRDPFNIPVSQKMLYRAKVILIDHLKNLPKASSSHLEQQNDEILSPILSIAKLYNKYYPSESTYSPLKSIL